MSALSVVVPERDEEWHAFRRQGIGSSDAAGVAGISPWSSPISVWLDKIGLAAEQEPSEAMLWGTLLEPVIVSQFEQRTGFQVIDRQKRVVHPEHSWMRATLDGQVVKPDNVPFASGLYEGKTAGDWGRASWAEGVPVHYVAQVQHAMACTGTALAWVVALLSGQQLVSFVVERDQGSIDILIELERNFWERYVLTQTPPPFDGGERTTEAIRDAFAEATVEAVELPQEALELVRASQAADIEEKAARERGEAARNQIRVLLGDREIGLWAGSPLATWKQVTQERIDAEALRVAEPSIAARFTTKSTHRRLHFPKREDMKGATT